MGLSLALFVALFLVCNVTFHRSFDVFHPDSERIYNVYVDEIYHGTADIYGEMPLAFGEYFKELFPEVEKMVRTKDVADVLVTNDRQNTFKEDILWVDPSFSDVFDLTMLAGDKKQFLNQPGLVYISESLSRKMFGDLSSVGETIRVDENEYSVAGVFKDYPRNSHQKFSILGSLEDFIPSDEFYKWDSYEFLTYIKLRSGADSEQLQDKLQSIIQDYWIPWVKNNYNLEYAFSDVNSISLNLLPVSAIHLNGSFISSFEEQSNISLIYLNLTIVIVLLFIAFFNLMGFSVSKGKKQQVPLRIRRYLGVSSSRLIFSFILDTFLYTCLAFVISFIAISVVWEYNPSFLNEIRSLSPWEYVIPVLNLFTFSIIVAGFTGLILGVFFEMMSRRPKRNQVNTYSDFWLNRGILLFQMTASIILLAGLFVVYQQLKFISDYDIAIDTENIVVLNNGYRIGNHYDAFKMELTRSSLIGGISSSNSYPFNWMSTSSYIHTNSRLQDPYPFQYFRVDTDFREVFDFKITDGRWFSDEYGRDVNAIVLNEAAVQKMGLTNPIGEEFYRTDDPSDRYTVIGVADNFNFRSLHHRVEPLLMKPLKTEDWWRYIVIKGTTDNREQLLDEIQQAWNSVTGQRYFDYTFLEDQVALLYEKERSLKRFVLLFSLVAILISCFGLLGTVLNTITEKTKEIGIRKVVGASILDILKLLTANFNKWILLANIMAWPIAWYIIHSWLQNFAYRIDLSTGPFLVAGVVVLIIANTTVSWQAIRAARANPVESLRSE